MRHMPFMPSNAAERILIELPRICIEGTFDIQKVDIETGEVTQHLRFPNIITDYGLDKIGEGKTLEYLITTMSVTSNTTPPSPSDGYLDYVLNTTDDDGGIAELIAANTSPEYSYRRIHRVFQPRGGTATYADIGFTEQPAGPGEGNPLYWITRTLIKDPQGNPVTLEHYPTEYLRVYYEYKLYAPQSDITGSVRFGPPASSSFVYTIRPQNIGGSDGWLDLLKSMGDWSNFSAKTHEDANLGSRTGNNDPSPQEAHTSSSLSLYSTGNFYRDTTFFWTFSDSNFTSGVGLITWNPWWQSGDNMIWQMHMSESINKTANNRLEVVFRQYWGRN